MSLEGLPLARLRFDLEATEAADVPAYKGDMLRMALLWWLSEYWCPMPTRCRHGCRRPEACMFGRINEPPVDPFWSPEMRRLIGGDTPPPAYVLWDRQDRRRHLPAGAAWSFELTLVGELAVRQMPAIVAAVQQGAEQGMGRIRVLSRVQRVTSLRGDDASGGEVCLAAQQPRGEAEPWPAEQDRPPARRQAEPLTGSPDAVLTWQNVRLDDLLLGYQQAVQWAAVCPRPLQAISLRYLSPVKIKERGQWVEEPEFVPVMKALVRRLRLLSLVHGRGEWPHAKWGPLLDLAETVRLEHQEMLWAGYTRRSKTSGTQEIEGFVGQAWYAGEDMSPLLPFLWLGQWLHIGKGYVLGNGRYSIEQLA